MKKYVVKAPLSDVYNAMTDVKTIEQWSGAPAEMDLKENGKFSLFGGALSGTNVSVSRNRIVQKWKEKNSFGDSLSDLEISITSVGNSVEVLIDHQNIPEAATEIVSSGWDNHFMGPMTKFLEKS